MANLPIHWIEVRTYCHATEEEARVAQALDVVCSEGTQDRDALEGHFGNPLVRFTRRVEQGRAIRALWERWSATGVLEALGTELDARVDEEGILHFRLDKQAAYQGTLALAKDADVIDVRLKLMAFPAKPEEARRVARSLMPEAR